MRIRLIVSSLFASTTLAAQAPADTSRASAWHVRLSAGPDVRYSSTSGFGTIGIERERDSRIGLRLNAEYYSRVQRYADFVLNSCGTGICTTRSRLGFTGLSADGRFNLLTGRIRPYVVSGLGVYRSISVHHTNFRCGDDFSCVLTPGELSDMKQSTFGLGMHAGFGLSMQWRGAQIFTESRYQSVMDGMTRGAFAMPVTLGIRF